MSQTATLYNIGDLSLQPHFGLNVDVVQKNLLTVTEFQLLRIYSNVRNIKLGLIKLLVFIDPPLVLVINKHFLFARRFIYCKRLGIIILVSV